jgi:membrane protein YdbS with pleckstrin-like domain
MEIPEGASAAELPASALAEPSQPLPRQALSYWRTQSIATAVAVAIAVMAVFGGLWAAAALVAGLALAIAGPMVLWRRWRYEIRPEEIDLRHGLFTVRRTLVPIRRVQHVDTETGPLQGMFELATVSFHTAAGSTKIPALLRGEAETVRRRVAELTRTRDDT